MSTYDDKGASVFAAAVLAAAVDNINATEQDDNKDVAAPKGTMTGEEVLASIAACPPGTVAVFTEVPDAPQPAVLESSPEEPPVSAPAIPPPPSELIKRLLELELAMADVHTLALSVPEHCWHQHTFDFISKLIQMSKVDDKRYIEQVEAAHELMVYVEPLVHTKPGISTVWSCWQEMGKVTKYLQLYQNSVLAKRDEAFVNVKQVIFDRYLSEQDGCNQYAIAFREMLLENKMTVETWNNTTHPSGVNPESTAAERAFLDKELSYSTFVTAVVKYSQVITKQKQ